MSVCERDGRCPAWQVRKPRTEQCIHRDESYDDWGTQGGGIRISPYRKISRPCLTWKERGFRTCKLCKIAFPKDITDCRSEPVKQKKKPLRECDDEYIKKSGPNRPGVIRPRRVRFHPSSKQYKQQGILDPRKASPIVKLLNNIKDITSISEIQDRIDDPSNPSRPSTYLNGNWWSIPKVLRSGSQTFIPTKILGHGSFGVVFAYKEEGKENQPDTLQNTIALKLVKGKSVADSDCKGTLEYFPKSKNFSQICKGVIYQRCISPKGFLVPSFHGGDPSPDRLSFYIVMELMDGDLDKISDDLTPAAKRKVVLQIKAALMCLLEHKRYYADLSTANVFFTYSKHYKGNGPINPKDIGTVKLGDLASICKKGQDKPASTVPPSRWEVFGGSAFQASCTEDTMVWQFAMLVFSLYMYKRLSGLENDDRTFLEDRLTRLRSDITVKNFPKLPISKFKEVFNLDLDNHQKNRVRFKSLFN